MEKKRVPLRSDSKALQEQGLRMEERLKELKAIMAKEKAKRERSNGMFWKSGQKGALHHHKEAPSPQKSSAASSTKRPARIRVLTESNIKKDIEQYRVERAALLKEKETSVEEEGAAAGEGKKERGNTQHLPPPCGQCEDKRASLFCVECEEKYCESCYIEFHRRGALTRHHAQPLGSDQSSTIEEVGMATSRPTRAVREERRGGDEHGASGTRDSGSLLEGSFNEDASTASFQEALMAWRTGGADKQAEGEGKQVQEKGPPPALAATATQSDTPPSSSHSPVGVADYTTAPSLSYLDRILIRKHRTDPFFLARQSSGAHPKEKVPTQDPSSNSTAESLLEGETTHQPSQYNLFYSDNNWVRGNASEWGKEEELPVVVRCKSRVEIEELVSSVGVSEAEVTQQSQPTTAAHTDGLTVRAKDGAKATTRNTKSAGAAPRQAGGSKGGSSRKQSKNSKARNASSTVSSQEIAPESGVNCLVRESVRQAWDECRRTQSRAELGTFFLAGMSECKEGGANDHYHDDHQSLLEENSKSSGPVLLSALWDPSTSSEVDREDGVVMLPSDGEEEEEESGEYLRPESVLMMAHQLDERNNRQEDSVADAETLQSLAWELESNATEARCDTALSVRAESREELDFSDEPLHHLEDSLCAEGNGLTALSLFNQQSMSQVLGEMDNEMGDSLD